MQRPVYKPLKIFGRTQLLKGLLSEAAKFSKSNSGTVGMIFGIAAVPAMLFVGAGVDIYNASNWRNKLQQAVDSTALATAKLAGTGANQAALNTYAAAQLAATSAPVGATLRTGFPSVNSTTGEVCVKADYSVKTAVMRIANVNSINTSAESCARVAAASFEIALVLDTTGSMANQDNSGKSKISSLITSANGFVDSMFDSSTLGPRTKMSVVPFAPSVNVGTTYSTAAWMDTGAESSWHWKSPMFVANNTIATNRFALFNLLSAQESSWAWKGCVESLPYPANTTDSPVSNIDNTKFVPMLAPDEPADVTQTTTNSKGKTTTTTIASYDNNYIGDKGFCTTAAPTDNSTASQTTAQSRLCKYKTFTNKDTSNGPNSFCNSKPLVRLQTTKASLKTTINSLAASGSTNIHEGFMWGWRTISPNAPFSDGRPYGTADNQKIIILMTDGMNTWSSLNNALNGSTYSAYGHYKNANGRLPSTNQNLTTSTEARNAMDKLVRESCSAARAQGVIIYTIAFSVPSDPIDAQGIQLLKDCAGDISRYYAPSSSTTLTSTFAAIGSSVGQLRLSK